MQYLKTKYVLTKPSENIPLLNDSPLKLYICLANDSAIIFTFLASLSTFTFGLK